jgi:hypothetical protein
MGMLGAVMLDSIYCYAECRDEKGSDVSLSRTVRDLDTNSQDTL